MGSWNGTCVISNLHIHARQDVVVFLLAKNQSEQTFCYSNALYEPCLIPFYGEYDDYGAVENCQGPGLPIILEEMRRQLYEFGQGPNSAHDCVVRRNNFNIELLFEADHEDRLGIEQFDSWNQDEYDIRRLEEMQNEEVLTNDQKFELDRLFSKLKKKDNFRRVTHVTIHREVFNDIIENFYIRDYVGEGKGNQGYNNSYRTVYFKDIVKDIPAYIASLKEEEEKFKASDDPGFRIFRKYGSNHYDRDDPNLAKKMDEFF
jgi:hypothetical protein